jgi:hypothetical protein
MCWMFVFWSGDLKGERRSFCRSFEELFSRGGSFAVGSKLVGFSADSDTLMQNEIVHSFCSVQPHCWVCFVLMKNSLV